MIRVTKDGRTIRTGQHYTEFRQSVWERCEGICEKCGRQMVFNWQSWFGFHIHHGGGRGMGGGKRDDAPDKVIALCNPCHRKEHGQ